MPCPALPYTSSASPFLPSSHLSSSASPLLWSSRESLKPTVLISSEDLEETHHNHTHRNSEGISEFESVCVDVVLKVDTLLSSSTPNKTLAMGDRGNDLLLLTQEAKDYLKILHALIKEEWVAPEFITRADNELLCRRVPSFIDLSLRCLDYGFSSPSSVSVSDSVDTSDALLRTVDVGLVSISLAILFALVTSLPLSSSPPFPDPTSAPPFLTSLPLSSVPSSTPLLSLSLSVSWNEKIFVKLSQESLFNVFLRVL
jgi:hypothetical protein